MKTLLLLMATAVTEILGCYLPYLWLRKQGSIWLLLPAVVALGGFVWLLSIHPQGAAGRMYAAYGGIYITTALLWMWWIERRTPDLWDLCGAALCVLGALVIGFGRHK